MDTIKLGKLVIAGLIIGGVVVVSLLIVLAI
jgi:hypothetical protein